MYTELILFIAFFIMAKYIYSNYKLSEEMFESHEHYQLVSDYFIGEKMSKRKPILWMHTSTEVNARNWQSFYSRNSTKLNQPYLQITMKSIYDACKDSFNICLVDDDVFRRLLSWNVDLEDLADPVKSHYRNLGMSMILHQYGGMFVPQSFLCMKNLIHLYHDGLSHNTMFVVENVNHTTDSREYMPDSHFMGCKKNSSIMKQWIDYQETLYLDKTAQSDILGNDWLYKKDITIVDGKYIGVKQQNGDPVPIDELLGTEPIDIPIHYGILLPQQEILSRYKYAWFARMSPEQILNSTLMINKYIIMSIKSNQI
jgi:hypothetical protein